MEIPIRYFMTEVRAVDWERSVRWYRDVLGLRVALEDAPGQFALLEVGPGGGRVAIKGGADDQPSGRGAVRLVFEVVNLDAMMAVLAREGVAFEGPKASAEGYREIKTQDPDATPVGVFSWVGSGSEIAG